jgi:hypothetical protein
MKNDLLKFFKIKSLLTLILFFIFQDLSQAQRSRPFYQGSGPQMMGDAYTAYNNNFDAVYYNPASVAKKGKPLTKIFDLELQGSQAMFTILPALGQLQGITTIVANNPGSVHSLGLGYYPQFMVKNFSVGGIVRSYTEAFVDAETGDLDLFAYTDLALSTHMGAALFGGILKIGAGAKVINRAEMDRRIPAAEVAAGGLSFGSEWKEGLGYGFDAGLLVQLPFSALPAWGVSVQDIGNTTLLERRVIFTGASGTPGSPNPIRQRINTGFSLNLKHAPGIKSGLSIDVKDLVRISENYQERINAGWELSFKSSIFFRVGVNQGAYWTAGVGLNLAGVILEGGSYGENLFWGTGTRRDDRKFVGRYALTF